MAKKQFKAESKRLLDLMINSIYTNKEIFLRELISNASDAMDKLYYRTLTDNISGLSREDFYIYLDPNKDDKTLTISDNGIGMTKEELEQNLGTICKSGSMLFKNESQDDKNAEDIDIIGQFGVGFYSAFMVAKEVEVISRAFGSDEAYSWVSTGADGYTIKGATRDTNGTTIKITLKDDTDDEKYSDFLEEYRIRTLVKKYSDYIRYPIKMTVTTSELKEGTEDEYEEITEDEVLNTMSPLWKKNKNEISTEEYNQFYKDNFYDYSDPSLVIHTNTEGAATYNALLFVPSRAPFNYYSKDYEKGLKLYASGVLIMDCCKDLLPDYFSFVKGLVDSSDLSLNISREMLQQDRQLQVIAKHLEKKIKSELLKLQRQNREKYEEFWKQFGMQIKYGIYSDFGMNVDLLSDLILFKSSFEDKYSTLEEYVSRMKEDQKYIYYACGDSVEKIKKLPQAELIMDKGYELLFLTENVDEFTMKVMRQFQDKEFRSISDDDLGLGEDDNEARKKKDEDNKELFDFMRDSLSGKVAAVKASSRLKSHPVCLSTEGGISLEMEKVLSYQPDEENRIKATKVLEINTDHKIFEKIKNLYKSDKDKVKIYTDLLYNQALLIEGMPIDDPIAFANSICELM
ncbi:MAG: molecular chaperone HtpG [Oscillospiraceae bacterium]|nr:molecular chaperone HtpG [Oscillospiraceae bacterium]